MESITKHLSDYNELGIVTFQTERLEICGIINLANNGTPKKDKSK